MEDVPDRQNRHIFQLGKSETHLLEIKILKMRTFIGEFEYPQRSPLPAAPVLKFETRAETLERMVDNLDLFLNMLNYGWYLQKYGDYILVEFCSKTRSSTNCMVCTMVERILELMGDFSFCKKEERTMRHGHDWDWDRRSCGDSFRTGLNIQLQKELKHNIMTLLRECVEFCFERVDTLKKLLATKPNLETNKERGSKMLKMSHKPLKRKGSTPLEMALEDGNFEIAKLLIIHGAKVKESAFHHYPLKYKTWHLSQRLVGPVQCTGYPHDEGKQYSNRDVSLCLEMTRLLIEKKANINFCERGIVEEADNERHLTPLELQLMYGELYVVKCLVENNADINRVSCGEKEPVRITWERDPTCLKVTDDDNFIRVELRHEAWTPFHIACGVQRSDCIEYLIENKADFYSLGGRMGENTPLSVALGLYYRDCHRCYPDVSEQLDIQMDRGQSCLDLSNELFKSRAAHVAFLLLSVWPGQPLPLDHGREMDCYDVWNYSELLSFAEVHDEERRDHYLYPLYSPEYSTTTMEEERQFKRVREAVECAMQNKRAAMAKNLANVGNTHTRVEHVSYYEPCIGKLIAEYDYAIYWEYKLATLRTSCVAIAHAQK